MISPFDPTLPLPMGRTIIEASAGTGKTSTISALATRLVAVDGIPLERILIVTFTRAATAELKDRVRARMAATLADLAGSGDRQGDPLFSQGTDEDTRRAARERLQRALADFDRAQIFTIHGFAHRLLGQLGFRVAIPETLEPGEIDDSVLVHTAADLVADYTASAGPDDPVVTGKDVVEIARLILAHPDAGIIAPSESAPPGQRASVELARRAAAEVRRRMRISGMIAYDDGLMEVEAALADDATADLLARRYEVALIDESQDTDPIQWRILRRVFARSRLVVIGDPKQSIYNFRGADIESYLAATRDAARHHTLDTNWRSDGPLVDALDHLFAGATFGGDDIAYRRVRPAPGREAPRIRGIGAPLRIRNIAWGLSLGTYQGKYYVVKQLRALAAADAAAEIVRLLEAEVKIEDESGKWRSLTPADIAVLCRKGSQVEAVQAELGARQVPSVSPRAGPVLTTPGAEEWHRFLSALERPEQMSLVRAAATTQLVGCSLPELAALDDEGALSLQRRFRSWQRSLEEEGVPALVAALEDDTALTERVLSDRQGERLLTDLLHVAEELHLVWRRGRHGSLSAWLQTAMAEAAAREKASIEEPDSRQRRLETDADAVIVQTVHSAKGLEYPVVLVPFAWDVWFGKDKYPLAHDPGPVTDRTQPRPRLLHLGGPASPDRERWTALAEEEARAEESRLLYVALTRARHHLIVWWTEHHKGIENAKLTELLSRNGRSPQQLAAASGGTIEVSAVEDEPSHDRYSRRTQAPIPLEVARFVRPIDHTWRRASFSSLVAQQPASPSEELEEDLLRADEGEPAEEEEEVAVGSVSVSRSPLAEMPRGARFGTLVHAIMERLPFHASDLDAAIASLLASHTRTTAWDFDTEAFVNGISDAVNTPLGPDPAAPALADLAPGDLLRELEFELPVRESGSPVTPADIARVMDRFLPADDRYRPYLDDLARSPATAFRGYLAGAIDLVARMPDGRFVVMDYKSNAVAPDGGDPYGPESLAAEMVRHRYVLQATLYQVALHRYLEWRLAGYQPTQHLGGSVYLFVRGMVGRDTPVIAGERAGVARWLPPPPMIVALSKLLVGVSS